MSPGVTMLVRFMVALRMFVRVTLCAELVAEMP
jgi:hypothetical protein